MVIESEIHHSLESRSWKPTKDSRFNIFNFNRSKYLPERKMNIIHHKTLRIFNFEICYQAVNFLITFNPPLDLDTGQVSSKPRKPLKNSVLSRHIYVTLDLRIWLFGDLGNVFILVSQCALAQSLVTQWHLLIRQCRPPVMSTYVSLFVCMHITICVKWNHHRWQSWSSFLRWTHISTGWKL